MNRKLIDAIERAEVDQRNAIVALLEHMRDTETDSMAWKALNLAADGVRAGAFENFLGTVPEPTLEEIAERLDSDARTAFEDLLDMCRDIVKRVERLKVEVWRREAESAELRAKLKAIQQ